MLKKPKTDAAAGTPAPKVQPGVPSLISADVEIEGNIKTAGEVQFDGTIRGNVRAGGLVIGESATVTGEVAADRVRVCGTVRGVVRAGRVELAPTAVIEGDVMHQSLTVEDGAKLDGKVCCMEKPLGDAKPAPLDKDKVAKELAELPAMKAKAA